MSDIGSKPWLAPGADIPSIVDEPKGMIGPEERRAYYWLGRNWLSGAGCIVDAGAFVGASALCFAAGAADGGRRDFKGGPLVHAYDYFKVVDKYVGEAISRDFRPIATGESYLDIFESQTALFADTIRTHPGDLLRHRWNRDPIEILFIDIAKTALLNSHVIREFFPHLIPGRSVLLQQDYYHCWHPYIHIGMEFFDDEFELVDELVAYQTRIWRLVKPLPAEKVARMSRYDLTKEERLALLDRLIAKSSERMRPMLRVVRIWQLCLDQDWGAAASSLASLRSDTNLDARKELWAHQARQIEVQIEKQRPAVPHPRRAMSKVTVLLSHERSGSHLLGEIISSFSNVRMYDEVCNAGAVRPTIYPFSFHRFRRDWMIAHENEALEPGYQSQVAFLRDYFDVLTDAAAGRNVVVDIKYGHIHHFEGMWCPVFRRPFLFSFAQNEQISFIHLFRMSVIEAAISSHLATVRQVWHSWQKEAADTTGQSFVLDPAEVARDAELLGLQRSWISDHWLGRGQVYQITYEEVVGLLEDGSNFDDLARFVGGSPPAERRTLRHQKVTRSIADAVRNLEEVKAACLRAGLRDDHFLREPF